MAAGQPQACVWQTQPGLWWPNAFGCVLSLCHLRAFQRSDWPGQTEHHELYLLPDQLLWRETVVTRELSCLLLNVG